MKHKMKLKEHFLKAVKNLFTSKEKPTMPYNHIRQFFELDHNRFVRKEHLFGSILDHIREAPATQSQIHFQPIFAYHTDPSSKLHFGNAERGTTESVQNSSGIFFAEYDLSFGRKVLALTIRSKLEDIDHEIFTNSLAFALYGLSDKHGNFRFKKLMVPKVNDKTHIMEGMQKIPLDKENIEIALAYAKRCQEQLINHENLTPRANMQQVMRHKEKALSSRWKNPSFS